MLKVAVAPPSDIFNCIEATDWVELCVLLSEMTHVGRLEVKAHLRTQAGDDSEAEEVTEFVFSEIRRRSRLAPESYPFLVKDGGIDLLMTAIRRIYVFMLLLATSSLLRSEKRQAEVEPIFDNVVLSALRQYLGPGSNGVRFGTPVTDGRPTRFVDALLWLAEKLRLQLGPAAHKRPLRNDGGADVVVWRPFNDGRMGFISVLAQCTVQTDWRAKAKDIVEDLWRGWIDFGKNPVTCLAIPFVVPASFNKWDEVCRTVVFVLDRMRIMELLATSHAQMSTVDTWIQAELKALANANVSRHRLTKSRRHGTVRHGRS